MCDVCKMLGWDVCELQHYAGCSCDVCVCDVCSCCDVCVMCVAVVMCV